MILTDEQVQHFQRHGYVAVPHFWSEREIRAMRAELDRLQSTGKLRNVSTEGDGKTHSREKLNMQLCPMAPHSDFFRAMPFAPKVAEAVSQLIGDPVLFHLDQVFVKPARQGSGTNWHQDNAYFQLEDPLRGTALWTAVHDATIENGTLEVIPDLFNQKLEHSRDGDSDHHIRCFPPEDRAVPIELEAGGVIFFAYGTPHCTRGNKTDHDRAGVALHFHNGNYSALGGYAPDKRVVLTGPGVSGGEREYGVRVGGTWEREVERLSPGKAVRSRPSV